MFRMIVTTPLTLITFENDVNKRNNEEREYRALSVKKTICVLTPANSPRRQCSCSIIRFYYWYTIFSVEIVRYE